MIVTRGDAVRDFRRARLQAKLEQLMAQLTGKSSHLLSYEDVSRQLRASRMVDRGIQDIPLDSIVGSVGRYRDFTRSFLPLVDRSEERWANVKLAQESKGTPPIDVYQIGEAYFVLDGNHRVSVSKQLGLTTIEAHVVEVETETSVTMTPEDQPDDLIMKAEYADFLKETRLDKLRPEADLSVTVPGKYPDIIEHIRVHQYYLGMEKGRDVDFSEAVTSWYDQVYLPTADLIWNSGILREFPDRTPTDLYLWLSEHRAHVEESLGLKVRPLMAIDDLKAQAVDSKSALSLSNVLRSPDSPPVTTRTRWQVERLGTITGDRLFETLLVPIRPDMITWRGLDQSLLVAQREGGHIWGLYTVPKVEQEEWLVNQALRDAFLHRCEIAGVPASFRVETGDLSEQAFALARWMDLTVLHLPLLDEVRRARRLHNVLFEAPGSVLLVTGQTTALQNGLLYYDGSPQLTAALAAAAYVGQRWQSQITVLVPDGNGVREEAQAYLEHFGVAAHFSPAGEKTGISQVAVDCSCDFIIVGGSGDELSTTLEVSSGTEEHPLTLPLLICR